MRWVTIAFVLIISLLFLGASYAPNNAKGDSATHDNNNYWLTVFMKMYEEGGEYPGGSGIDNLYMSGCWVGVTGNGPSTVSNWYYGSQNEFFPLQSDIYTTDGYWPGGLNTYGDFDTYVLCDDSNASENGPIPISIARHTWSFTNSYRDDYVGFKYIVRNDSDETWDDLYITHVADFDIGGEMDYIDDVVDYDLGRSMPYMYDDDSSYDAYCGIVPGSENWTSVGMSYWDIANDPDNDFARLNMQRNAGWYSEDTPYDWRIALTFHYDGADFGPGDTIVAGFYQVAGMSLKELRDNADFAISGYEGGGGFVGIKSASLGEIKAMYK